MFTRIGQLAFLLAALAWGAADVCQAASAYLGQDKVGFSWITMPGTARDIAINASGQVAVVDPGGAVWQWGKVFPRTWDRLGGDFRRVALSPAGEPWAVDRKGNISHYHVGWWVSVPGKAVDIASAGDTGKSYVAIADPRGRPLRWDAKSQEWQPFPSKDAAAPGVVRIALDAKGEPWVVTDGGAIWRLQDKHWRRVPGSASDIAVGPLGQAYITTPQHTLYRWNHARQRWTLIADVDNALTVAVGPEDKPWFVATGGGILASDLFQEKPKPRAAKARAPGAKRASLAVAVTSTEPLSFVRVSGYAQQVAIGTQGSVFITGQDGTLARWSQLDKAFVAFPGVLGRVAVDPQGLPWGLSGGAIYHFDGSRWNLIPGSAVDIAVGYDGTVMIADIQHRLYRYSPEQNRFLLMPSQFQGSQIAVDPHGNPWIIRADHSIYRCDQEGCVKTPLTGSSIAIGPDGSVFMTGLDQHLYRWDATHLTWAQIDTPIAVADVAVGPYGRPWVVDSKGEIYASRFFHRDERNDAAQTAVAAYRSSTSPVSTFTFTKSLIFTRVPLPGGANPYSVKVGADGVVYVSDGLTLYKYNRLTDRMVANAIQPGFVNFAVAESDGRLWYQRGVDADCYRQVTVGGTSFVKPTLDGAFSDVCRDLAVGADNSVFVVASTTAAPGVYHLYRYDNAKGRFVLFSDKYQFKSVGVDPSGNPWVVTSDYRVWRYDGKQLVAVPGGVKPQRTDGDSIAVGPTGAVYLVTTSTQLYKWNNTNQSFDRVNRNNVSSAAADAHGRPWIIDISASPSVLFRAR